MKKYKAVIFDIDGVLVPIDPDAKPTKRVRDAIVKAHDKAFIAAATGRGPNNALHVIHALDITNLSVMRGGSMIMDPTTEKVVWEQLIEPGQIKQIIDVFLKYADEQSLLVNGDIEKSHPPLNPTDPTHIVYIEKLPQDTRYEMLNELNEIEGISAHFSSSWNFGSDYHEIHINHEQGDKEHGIKQLLKMANLKPEEVIGVGDRSSDLPLFNSVGLRVAVANATDDLKEAADYIAPSVFDDGAAHVIEKFILGQD